ncbi:aminoglycoside phosphotransferase family protein [Actinopolymorpha sp. B9G3]|uniref:aminoglycoside phosphotransferase family protein n=1 Tax=Actinopolymorpha sp. B9G3 TaxID=3158970 RepID=UPI0032D984D2
MTDTKAAQALRALGHDPHLPTAQLAGSMSQSGVYGVHVDGQDAVLKVTAADEEQHLARRELTFYRTLAGTVPVPTPTLLDSIDTDELTALLLTARGTRRHAAKWRDSDWLLAAGQLAALHSTVVPDRPRWRTGDSWLQRLLAKPPTRAVVDYWDSTPAAAAARRGLADTEALARAINALPECLVHGDCHADNLLQDDGDIIWIDWQGVHIGNPAGDLSFLWSRANADGATLPRDAMLAEYLSHRPVDALLMRRSLIANELALSLYGWPEYGHLHTPDERQQITQRVIDLEHAWQESPAE